MLSATHGGRLVYTYLNKKAEKAGMTGNLPFSVGSILAKESFANNSGSPGAAGPLFIMEKQAPGYDTANGDWKYAMVVNGKVTRVGSGKTGSPVQFCAGCHILVKSTDFVYGNGTRMKLK
ncbi:MAG: cytochrome P460 family protein [Gammaproteobacteria bacterium]